jgi:hypothetical protein
MEPVPRHLFISAQMGNDWLVLDFLSEAAARIIIPSESSLAPCSVHEVIGFCQIEGVIGGARFAYQTYGIVEFTGGAGGL